VFSDTIFQQYYHNQLKFWSNKLEYLEKNRSFVGHRQTLLHSHRLATY